MKKNYLGTAIIILFAITRLTAQSISISDVIHTPATSAVLDVYSTSKGMLVPNIALTSTTDATTIASPAVSLLVYNTAIISDVTPGYYYNSGTESLPVWTKFVTTAADGSETKVTAGTNITVTGTGTVANPYVINSSTSIPGTVSGDMQYWNGAAWVILPVGLPGQFLHLTASSIPEWSGAVFSTLTTTAASSITGVAATSGGNITNDGGGSVTARGVCWNTSANPTIANNKTSNGIGTGSFSSSITGLSANTICYVRAYATNSAGTAYGVQISFTTPQLTIGDSYQGGKIFYILLPGDPGYDANVQHGLIASPSDLSQQVIWGEETFGIIGTSGTINAGFANTNAIVAGCNWTNIAAYLCDTLTSGGYTDWFLPSSQELEFMYLNLYLQGLGGFALNNYWSSSEVVSDEAYSAWNKSFVYGWWAPMYKGNMSAVRAARAF